MKKLLNAGYLISSFHNVDQNIFNTEDHEIIKRGMKRLSTFSLESNAEPNKSKLVTSPASPEDNFCAIAINILNRGLPTLAPLLTESSVGASLKCLRHEPKMTQKNGHIDFFDTFFNPETTEWKENVLRSMYPIDPRINQSDFPADGYDSESEHIFHTTYLQLAMNTIELPLLLERQRSIASMVDYEARPDFVDQRADFSFEVEDLKYVFEVDGIQHSTDLSQANLDKKRELALTRSGWKVIRIPSHSITNTEVQDQLKKEVLNTKQSRQGEILSKNIENPLWSSAIGRDALSAVLVPFGVARIIRTIVEAIRDGILSFNDKRWSICILERDLRCGYLSLSELSLLLNAFLGICYATGFSPFIVLDCYYSSEFSGQTILLPEFENIIFRSYPLESFTKGKTKYNVVIDLSMLGYEGFINTFELAKIKVLADGGKSYKIRNSYHFEDNRQVSSLAPIEYAAYPETNEKYLENLNYFLKNIFRKEKFREGQAEIISRALNLKPVIGLLPTGAGKSLTFQFASLLQPGCCIIVDPLKSLMVDQVENLNRYLSIDFVDSISSFDNTSERKKITRDFQNGRFLLLFMSPERLQNNDFRESLRRTTSKFPVTYLVIDEAHCVSEWGHDFRTSYLNIVNTTIKNAMFRSSYKPTVIALTGTASARVLADVQREVGVKDEDAKISPKSFKRPELIFEVIKIPTIDKLHRLVEWLNNYYLNIPNSAKESDDLQKLPSGILFTINVNGKFGAYPLTFDLKDKIPAIVNYFSGEPPKDADGRQIPQAEFESHKLEVQRDFMDDKINLLVATKAFGMGIDKPNIRFTIHYNLPQSLESFYQEAGRAGRDKENSSCVMLFSDDNSMHADEALKPEAGDREVNKLLSIKTSCDISRVLYLHKQNFKGKEIEAEASKKLLASKIYPALKTLQANMVRSIAIDFKFSGPIFGEFGQSATEKIIYRLSILGIVKDYTVDFSASIFRVDLLNISDEQCIENLWKYIFKYKSHITLNDISTQIRAGSTSNMVQEKCIDYLIDFVYEEIEKKRRAAIGNMLEACRMVSDLETPSARNKAMQDVLENYLAESKFSDMLLNMAKNFDAYSIESILQKVDETGKKILASREGIRQLFGGTRRIIEEYPETPGSYFLSAFSRLLQTPDELDLAFDEINSAVHFLFQDHKDQVKDFMDISVKQARYWIIDAELSARVVAQILTSCFLKDPSSEMAIVIEQYDTELAEQCYLNLMLVNTRAFNKTIG